MKKQIVITRVLEFGGNNTYLKTLIRYWKGENLLIILKSNDELIKFRKIDPKKEIAVKVIPNLKALIFFSRGAFLYNLKELFYLLRSLLIVSFLSAKNGFAGVTISVIDPEEYIHFLWLPFIKVKYILHSKPLVLKNTLTTITCNKRLDQKRNIITVSKANRNCILSTWKVIEEKAKYVYTIYNCLDEDKISGDALSEKGDNQVVLTMGHVIDYKNPYFWLQVAMAVTELRKDVYFYWLGNGPLFEYFVEQTKHNDKIRFVGVVETPSALLTKAAVYYQPSLVETQGIAVIEAMAHHLPCVVSNIGGLPESVVDNNNGFIVDETNVDENISRIVQLLDSTTLRETFGKNSYERYRQLFTYKIFAQQMDKAYEGSVV